MIKVEIVMNQLYKYVFLYQILQYNHKRNLLLV